MLLLAIGLFGRLELQHRPGAGWILIGLLAWLLRLLFSELWPLSFSAIALASLLTVVILLTFMLAVRKQLRLTIPC